jgi:hypothetical protein
MPDGTPSHSMVDFGTGKEFRRKDYEESEKTGDFLSINPQEMEVMLEAEANLDCVSSFIPGLS